MPRFKRKKITVDQAGRKHGFRSGLEEKIIQQLKDAGLEPNYEGIKFDYIIPESKHVYTPDFPVCKRIVIETKGRWVLEDRQKMLLLMEQHPEIEFRMVFYNAKHNIKWANKQIPEEWL